MKKKLITSLAILSLLLGVFALPLNAQADGCETGGAPQKSLQFGMSCI